MTDTVRERLAALDSCAVSDALDTLGLPGAVTGIRGISLPEATIVGRARTVLAGPRSESGPQAHIAAALVDQLAPGEVVVISNDGRTDVSCWGGLLGAAAVQHGAAGVVIDGAFRDIQENAELGLPVFARAAVAVSARGRIVQLAMDEPVKLGHTVVSRDDWIIADQSGVAVIPQAETGRVIALAERIVDREARMLALLKVGRSVTEIMHDSKFPSAEPADLTNE